MKCSLYITISFGLVAAAIGLPVLAADNPAARGARVYGQMCAGCHGQNMVYPGRSSFDLRTFPADRHDRFINSVMNGKGAMPAWQGTVTPAQAEDLWDYVLTAKPKAAASLQK
jgi:mono/diheme cytochrome c family protein